MNIFLKQSCKAQLQDDTLSAFTSLWFVKISTEIKNEWTDKNPSFSNERSDLCQTTPSSSHTTHTQNPILKLLMFFALSLKPKAPT